MLSLEAGNIVARNRHGVGTLRQLDLEDHHTLMTEGELARDEVEFPHPAEPLRGTHRNFTES